MQRGSVIPNKCVYAMAVLADELDEEHAKAERGAAAKDAKCIAAFGEANGDKAADAALAFRLLWYPFAFLTIHQANLALPAYSVPEKFV